MPIEIWFQDEARIGQKNGLVYQWAKKGSRPPQPKDQRYASTYLFGAVCPERGVGAGLVLPKANTEAMQLHLDEIAHTVSPGAHAVVILDRAGWHQSKRLSVPANITLLPLPSYSPELNPVENLWQYLRQTWLSNRVFADYAAILEAACDAWSRITAMPDKLTQITFRPWALSVNI